MWPTKSSGEARSLSQPRAAARVKTDTLTKSPPPLHTICYTYYI